MLGTVPLVKRNLAEIDQNRRRLLCAAYEIYPEFVYCEPEHFNWSDTDARTNLFDLYYLFDSGYIDVVKSLTEGHRRPDFYMLKPKDADLMEIPGMLDKRFPVR
jgi:hypothetical protein